jgi:hypothetical protein
MSPRKKVEITEKRMSVRHVTGKRSRGPATAKERGQILATCPRAEREKRKEGGMNFATFLWRW